MSYFSAHNHSEYSNLRMLDCTNKLYDLIDKAVSMGLKGLALTDHESLSGHIKAMNYVKEGKEKGKIPEDFVFGAGDEIYLIDSLEDVRDRYESGKTKFYHFILIAKDKEGHRQLREISTQAWKNRFKTGKMERVPVEKRQIEKIVGKNIGHLIASTACIGGELADCILKDDQDQAWAFLSWCKQMFGEDFYLEMQPNPSDEQIKVNKALVSISNNLGIKYIITTDTHYLTKEMAPIHEAYLKSRGSEDREVASFYESCYMMYADEIIEKMNYFDSEVVETGLDNTLEIAGKIETYDLYHDQVVPKVSIPEFELENLFKDWYEKYPYYEKFADSADIHDRYWLYLVEQGYKNKVGDFTDESRISRINDELWATWETSEKIHDKISNYYITYLAIKDIVWDDSENGGNSLIGPGRGSVAAFYTGWLTGIHEVDSYSLDIPYWRFQHPDRGELPDIDFDSETRRRGQILQAIKNVFGEDKVLNICTFKTEGARSAIQTAARGLEIATEDAESLSAMIPVKRGFITPLSVMIHGNEEDGTRPDTAFIDTCNSLNPKLLEYALSIENLISGRSIHASGVIIFEEPYVNQNSMMTAPNGQPVTCFDMNDSTYVGGLKFDFLTVTGIDIIHTTLDFLVKYGYIKWQGSLKKTYEKYLAADVIDYDSEEMWEWAWYGKIPNLFQFDSPIGGQTIKKVKPKNLIELGLANALERLMAQEGDTEQPTDKYVRYANNEQEWTDCMQHYGLNDDEMDIVKKYLAKAHGISTMQEDVMLLSMDEHISGFTVKEANKLRKSIAKKKKKLQEEAHENFYKKGSELGTRKNMLDYVWQECVRPQLGYSFAFPHLTAYSMIAIQEMNLSYHYPSIIWATANLIINSGSDDQNIGESTDYGATAVAIYNLQSQDVKFARPDINTSAFGFIPEIDKNEILYGLKPISGVGDELAQRIIVNRPYASYEDFIQRVQPKNAELVALIKAGAFISVEHTETVETMDKFLRANVTPVGKLTLSQINRAIEFGIITEDSDIYLNYRMINFRKYVLDDTHLYEKIIIPDKKIPACGYHDRLFELNSMSQPFFIKYFSEDSIVKANGQHYVISEKMFMKELTKKYLEPLTEWLNDPEVIEQYNQGLKQSVYDHYVKSPVTHWNFDALNYYHDKHELADIDKVRYGIVNYFEQPEEPKVYDCYFRYINGERKSFPKYTITRIAGTVVDTIKDKHIVVLLTPYGIVKAKYNKGQFIFYNKRATGSPSWFARGTLLMVAGYRDDDIWRVKVYQDTIYKHTTSKITEIKENGELIMQDERIFEDE